MYKVLIVEDELIIRKGLIFSFDWKGTNCVIVGEAENGMEGISMITELKPDIVIADINLPVLNGLEMIEKTIDDHQYSAIIVTGYSEFEYAKKAVKYGVSEYLLKPLNHAELRDALQKAISRREIRKIYSRILKDKADIKEINVLDFNMDYRESIGVVQEMLEYIEKNYAIKVVMDDLSKYLNYSVTLLNRKFKEQMKTTYNEYLNRYRIQKAIEMIRQGNRYIYDIADSCGFNSYKYFNLVFKKYVGCSPKDFAVLSEKGSEVQ